MYELLYKYNYDKQKCPVYLLQTFYDLKRIKDQDKIQNIINSCKEFLLDSGAFTFMNSGKIVNWKQYVDEYVEFINKWDIKHFFELDLYTLDSVGIDTTYKIRKYIEYHTGKQSIPVFHGCLGLARYREMCKQYNYIAIGASGLTQECKWVNNTKLLKQLVDIASTYETKVHGLGYQRLDNLNNNKIGFYSVDATSWIGSRFNSKYNIRYGRITIEEATLPNERLKNYIQLDEHNMQVFRKLQILKEKDNE